MRYISDEELDQQEYTFYIGDGVQDRINKRDFSLFMKHNCLHDWYLTEIRMANTGTAIWEYSIQGKSTVQLHFTNYDRCDPIFVAAIYKNVEAIHIEMRESNSSRRYSIPTNMGDTYKNRIKLLEKGWLCHSYEFSEGIIEIVSHDVLFRKIR